METMRITTIAIAFAALTQFSGLCSEAIAQTAQSSPAPAATAPAESTTPVVTFRDGQLSVVAFNSPLSEVLELIRSKTGAIIDIPSGPDERVFVQLGPGPARRIVDSLLDGSDFNYAMTSPQNNPGALSTVVLSRRSAATTEPTRSPETATLAPETATGAVESSPAEIAQGEPPTPVQDAPEAAAEVSRLAQSVVRRASSQP